LPLVRAIAAEVHLAVGLEALRARLALGALLHAGRAIGAACLTTAAADGRHVLAVLADRHAALAARRAGFARVELVGRALLVRRATALAGDLALLAPIHRREAAIAARARGARLRRVVNATIVLTIGRARGSSALVRDFALPFTIGGEGTVVTIRSDRHYNSSWKCWAPALCERNPSSRFGAISVGPYGAATRRSIVANCGPMCLSFAEKTEDSLVFPTERNGATRESLTTHSHIPGSAAILTSPTATPFHHFPTAMRRATRRRGV
jgi:hypothetical protein